MRKNQILFSKGKKVIDYLEYLLNNCDLSGRDKERVQKTMKEMRTVLWTLIAPLAESMISSAPLVPSLLRSVKCDMLQDCYCIFQEKLSLYDPTRKSLAAYFYYYFKGVIYQQCCSELHMSAHELRLYHRIEKEREYICEYDGQPPIFALSERMHLSRKVICNNEHAARRMFFESLKKADLLPSTEMDVEEMILEEERSHVLLSVVERTLTKDERIFLFAYLNPSEAQCLTYRALGKEFDVSTRDARMFLSSIINKLWRALEETPYFDSERDPTR